MKVLLEIETCGAPKIANIMENRTAKPGDQITFNCKVDMSCMVSTINWYHEFENGTEIQIKRPGDRGQPDIHIINSVSPVDTGVYTCVAKNVIGRTHAAAYLAVNKAHTLLQGHRLESLLCLFLSWMLLLR